MKLELKHLSPYLPYGLAVKKVVPPYTNSGPVIVTGLNSGCVMINHDTFGWADLEDTKPILYPLSMLTQEIEHNGERFVPAKKIRQLYPNTPNWEYFMGNWIHRRISLDETIIEHCVFTKFCEWHLDVFQLIPAGLAIDKTSLKQ